jgi:hypothetical protein
MQATNLRTGLAAINRGFVGALLAVVIAAALTALLIIGTATRTTVGPAAAPAPYADELFRLRAAEHADAAAGSARTYNEELFALRAAQQRANSASGAGESKLWVAPDGDSKSAGTSSATTPSSHRMMSR